MRCSIVFVYIFSLLSVYVSAKVFDTRCKLVREIIKAGIPNDIFLGQWVCLIEKESRRNTSAFTETASGKKYYGLYQIPNRWCREGKKGGDCNIACESLLDDDIRDDTACAVNVIFYQEGFKYWPKWTARCKNDNFITMEIWKCPDLISYRNLQSAQRSENLTQRRKKLKSSIEHYIGPLPYAHNHNNVFRYDQAVQDKECQFKVFMVRYASNFSRLFQLLKSSSKETTQLGAEDADVFLLRSVVSRDACDPLARELNE